MGFWDSIFGTKKKAAGHALYRGKAFYFQRDSSCHLIRVVGESFYQDEISKATGRRGNEALEHYCIVAIVPEIDNPYDKNAINVQINGHKVGYLSRDDARAYRKKAVAAIQKGSVIAADGCVRAVDPAEADTPNAGVVLWLPPPEELQF